MKILLHTRPGYSLFLREIISFARLREDAIEWSAISFSNADNSLAGLARQLGDGNILYLQRHLNAYMERPEFDLDALEAFPASVFECILSSKYTEGIHSLLEQNRDYQLKLVAGTYSIYKQFLLEKRPDFVFFSLIEHYDAVVLFYLCIELGIRPIVYANARNLGVSYFSDSLHETLPGYALTRVLDEEVLARADELIQSFRSTSTPPFFINYKPEADEVIQVPGLHKGIWQKALKSCSNRFRYLMGDTGSTSAVFEPHLVDKYTFSLKLKAHFLPLTKRVRKFNGELARKYYDIRDLDELPSNFLYYPLQFSPEASINIPAPFFIDQFRAIDLLLTAMPPGYYLVVKEHPVMAGIRPSSFYKDLRQRGGILLADIYLPSIEIVKRAKLTVSVTGTACLEAFLLGRPSLHLGKAFFTDWIFSFDSFHSFRRVIKEAISSGEVPPGKIRDLVARVLSIGADFYLFCTDDPYHSSETVMNKRNVEKFLDALLTHIMHEAAT